MSRPEKSAGSGLVELVVIVAVALGLALGIQALLVKPYRIPSESMVPTLEVGQRVLVNRIGKRFSDPVGGRHRGLPSAGGLGIGHLRQPRPAGGPALRPSHAASGRSVNFIKRIVGGPGDLIAVRNGHVDPQRARDEGALHQRHLRW